MFYVVGEDFDGNVYEFESGCEILGEVRAQCQELLETLDGGHFDIFEINDEDENYVDCVEW